MRACPRGHLTLWPQACPTCRARRIPFQGTREERRARQAQAARESLAAMREAEREAIRVRAREVARKAMEKVKHASK